MTQHDPLLRLAHMRDHAREAVELLGEQSIDDLRRNRMLQLSLTRLVEIVGEAATKISLEFQQQHPELPWREAVAMRNILIHGYDIVDLNILHNTIEYNLPPLIDQLDTILRQM